MELKYSKYGIFWQPGHSVTEFVQFWKDSVRKVEPEAVYLNHPVHCTLFLLMADKKDEQDIISSLECICKDVSFFSIHFSGWHIFNRDNAADGGDTMTIGIELSAELLYLQQNIAKVLLKYKKENIYYPLSWKGDYLKSYTHWGFPFVGEHWMPHISIASVKKNGREIIFEAKKYIPKPKSEVLESISLFLITANEHILLKTFKINKNAG